MNISVLDNKIFLGIHLLPKKLTWDDLIHPNGKELLEEAHEGERKQQVLLIISRIILCVTEDV